MAWDFETDPEFQEQLDWMDDFVRNEVQPLDLVLDDPYDKSDAAGHGARRPRCRSRCRNGAVGLPPRPGARRPGLRPGEARADEPDPRPVTVRADGVRLPGTRQRQRRDPRPLRQRRPEGALPPAAARRQDQLVLLDDRTPCRRRPDPVHHQRGDRTATSGSSTARSGSPPTPEFASFFIVMAVTNPDVSAYEGMSMFIVPAETPGVNIIRNTGIGSEPEDEGSHALHALRQRPRDRRPPPRRPGLRLRDRPDPPRRRAHPSRDAHHRPGRSRLRHDVRASAVTTDPQRPARIARRGAGADRRHLDRDRAVQAARPAHRVEDRQVQRLPQGPQGHLRGEGRDAEGVPRRRAAGDASARRPRRLQRDAVHGDAHRVGGHGARRRPHRGPQEHRRPPGPARTQAGRRALADRPPPGPSRPPPGRSTPTYFERQAADH